MVKNEITVSGNLSPDQIELIKATVAKGATDDELKLFIAVAKQSGLDPFTRQIHFVKRRTWNADKNQYDEVGTIQTGIDGYRAIAARTGEHAGTSDADITEDEKGNPIKATVIVYRMVGGESRAFPATARFSEYAQKYKDKKTGEDKLMGQWASKPFLMISKCAEALALRKAFPNVLSGIYTEEEAATIETSAPEKRSARKEIVVEATAAPVRSVSVTNNKKTRITLLMKQAGIQPTANTAEAWAEAVKSQFDLDLVEDNYDEIISILEKTNEQPPEQA